MNDHAGFVDGGMDLDAKGVRAQSTRKLQAITRRDPLRVCAWDPKARDGRGGWVGKVPIADVYAALANLAPHERSRNAAFRYAAAMRQRDLARALQRLGKVKTVDDGKSHHRRLYAAFRSGQITKAQARLLGVSEAALMKPRITRGRYVIGAGRASA